ncbi:MAG TPA: hypothetical protein VF039_05115 [Longimicrobiales bacterium]
MTRRDGRSVVGFVVALCASLALSAAPASAQRFEDRWTGEDKVRHLAASAAITAIGYGGARVVFAPDESIGVALGAAAIAGLLRELHDGRDGRFSYKDLVWDAIGIAAGYFWIREIE